MSNNGRLIAYLIVVALLVVALIFDIVKPKTRLTAVGLIAAALAVAFYVPLLDVIKAT